MSRAEFADLKSNDMKPSNRIMFRFDFKYSKYSKSDQLIWVDDFYLSWWLLFQKLKMKNVDKKIEKGMGYNLKLYNERSFAYFGEFLVLEMP